MRLSLIAALDRRGVIGRGGDLPWHLSADLRRFKRLTMGHVIIMGRRTYESIGRPLPGRTSIVVTHRKEVPDEGVRIAGSLERAVEIAREAGEREEVFVIGGAAIYEQALPRVDRLYVTRVHAEVEGDTYFPACDFSRWRLVESEDHAADEKNPLPYSFLVYERPAA